MKKTAYSPIIVASLIFLGSLGLFGVEYYLLDTAEAQVTDLQKQVADKKVELEKAARARSALTTLGPNEEIINSYLLNKDDIVTFLENVQSTGKAIGATAQVVSVSDEKVAGHPRISVSLLISGSFDSVMRTVGMLENSSYDSTLTSVTLDSGGPVVKGVQQWSAATVLSVGLAQPGSTTSKKP
jgi:hypothetical protein